MAFLIVKNPLFRLKSWITKEFDRRLIFLFIVAFEVGFRVARAFCNPKVWPDSERYRSDNKLEVFDFLGGQGPGQIVQLINLFPLQIAVAIQAGLATIIWGLASYTVSGNKARAFLAMNLLSLSPWWTVWDISVLTEAITLSGVALFAAASGRRNQKLMLVGLTIALLSRPMLVPLLGFVMLIVWVNSRKLLVTCSSIACLVVIFASAQSIAFNTATVKYGWMEQPASISSIQAADRLLGRSNVESTIPNALKHGLPATCTLPSGPYKFRDIWTPASEVSCPGLNAFLKKGGTPWYSDLINDPSGMIRNLFTVSEQASYPMYYQTPTSSQRASDFFDVSMWIIVLTAIVLSLNSKRFLERTIIQGSAIVYGVVLWAVDGQEVWRHILPCLAFIIVYSAASWNNVVLKHEARHSI